jgi:sugar phosphate isomerase/epimerase
MLSSKLGLDAEPHGLNTLILAPTTLPDAAPLHYVEAAVAAGFAAVGLRLNRSPGLPFHPVLGDSSLIAAIKRALAGSGIRVFDVYSFYLEPQTDVASFEGALELGASLGARYAVVMGADPEWPRLCDNFGRMCELAGRFGFVCTVESAVTRPIANLQQTLGLIAAAGCTNAAICIDPLNFARAGDTPAALRRVDPALLPYAQITDGLIGPDEPDPTRLGRMGPNQRRLLGQGNVPLREILDALPRGVPLSIELPPPEGSSVDAAQWAKLALNDAQTYLRHGRDDAS